MESTKENETTTRITAAATNVEENKKLPRRDIGSGHNIKNVLGIADSSSTWDSKIVPFMRIHIHTILFSILQRE